MMTSETIVVVGHLQTTSRDARDKTIEQFRAIVNYSQAQEPGVIRYAITIPTDEADQTAIYAIEEYASQKVSDDHLATSPVQDLIKLFGSQPAVLADAPKVYSFGYSGDTIFSRPEIRDHPQGLIVFATAKQETEQQAQALTATWSAVVNDARHNEEETLLYGLLYDRQDKTQIGSIETYVSKDSFDHHCKSSAVAALIGKGTEVGAKMDFVALKLVTGFLMR